MGIRTDNGVDTMTYRVKKKIKRKKRPKDILKLNSDSKKQETLEQ